VTVGWMVSIVLKCCGAGRLPTYLSTCIPTYLPAYLYIYIYILLSMYLCYFMWLPSLPVCKPTFLSIHPLISTQLIIYLLKFLSTSIPAFAYLPTFPPTFLPTCLPSYQLSYLPDNLPVRILSFLPIFLPAKLLAVFLPTSRA
jgi:hypothetical protein